MKCIRGVGGRLALTAVAVAALGFAAATAEAGQITIYGNNEYRQGTGGEFSIQVVSGFAGLAAASPVNFNDRGTAGTGDDVTYYHAFQTFCMEATETISLGSTYYYSIETYAVGGGSDGSTLAAPYDGSTTNGQDNVSYATAWLYTQFSRGTLASYRYTDTTNRRVDAEQLQRAIWSLEGEYTLTGSDTQAATWVAAANAAVAGSWGNTIGDVRVLNLWNSALMRDTDRVQSQLTIIPLPSTALAGLGMLGALGVFGLVRRRRRHDLA